MYHPLMRRRVLILNMMVDRNMSDPVGQWSRFFRDVPVEAVHLPTGEAIPNVERFTHLLLSGSEASTQEPQPWMHEAANCVRHAAELNLSILGNCFGHQMLVWSLSGAEFTRRAPRPEVGWIEVQIQGNDPLLAGVPQNWHAFAFHLDEVCDLPPPWKTLAANPSCAHQAIRFGDRPIWGIQPHPEITPEEGMKLMRTAEPIVRESMPEYLPQLQEAIARTPCDDFAAQQLVDNFLASRS